MDRGSPYLHRQTLHSDGFWSHVNPDLAILSRDRSRRLGRARQTLPRHLARSRLRLATWLQKPSKCSERHRQGSLARHGYIWLYHVDTTVRLGSLHLSMRVDRHVQKVDQRSQNKARGRLTSIKFFEKTQQLSESVDARRQT
jgi:hypothetical protein